MAYSKQTWTDGADGGTPVSAARLTHIEDGIGDLDTGLVERVQDIIGAALVAGTNVDSITYNDGAGTVTINATTQAGGGGGPTTEQVQDLVATMVVEGSGIDVTYDDTAGTLTFAATGGGGGGSVQDTGVRDVLATWVTNADHLDTSISPNYLHASRVGSQITLAGDIDMDGTQNNVTLAIGVGWRPTCNVATGLTPGTTDDYINNSIRIHPDGTGTTTGAGAKRIFAITYTTTDPWPSSLPGTAV